MGWIDALEIVVASTRHEPFRERCAESHPDHRRWRDHVVELASKLSGPGMASEESPSGRPSAVEALALLAQAKACPYRSTHPPCGCQGARCALKNGAIVSHQDCMACVERFG